MNKNTSFSFARTVRAVRPVRTDGHWALDSRYPSCRCIPVRRTVRFNPGGR